MDSEKTNAFHFRYIAILGLLSGLLSPIPMIVFLSGIIDFVETIDSQRGITVLFAMVSLFLTAFYAFKAYVMLFYRIIKMRLAFLKKEPKELPKPKKITPLIIDSFRNLSPLVIFQVVNTLMIDFNYNKLILDFGFDIYYVLVSLFLNYGIIYHSSLKKKFQN